ncbi:VanW family protein [Aeromicrobium sp. CF4.19]|uniref:VanW family protein n=1 Tax=Aeromicrobium sp. CF4.19 TaxID=3373082 RepID=UPI003EE742E5
MTDEQRPGDGEDRRTGEPVDDAAGSDPTQDDSTDVPEGGAADEAALGRPGGEESVVVDDLAPDDADQAADEGDETTDHPAEETHGDVPRDHEGTVLAPGLRADWTEDDDVADQPRKRRLGRKILLGAVLALGALYLVGYALTGSRMPADATIGGVDVGGMSPAEARDAVDAELTPREDEPIQLVHTRDGETQEFEIEPADAGLAFDLDRSIDEAGGQRSWDPRDMARLFFGSHDHAPALDVDAGDLESTVERISETVQVEVVEALITFPDAEPKAREPEPGLAVDAEAAARTIRGSYLVQTEPVDVPTEAVEPAVDADGLADAMETIAEPAVSGPVVIEVGDEDEVELPVTAYAPALSVRVREGSMVPEIDPEELAEPLTDATTGIGERAVDASVDIVDGKPEVIPGKEGVGLQPQEMSEKLVPALTETGDGRVVQIEATVVEPEFTTEDAEKLGIKERVSEFETYYPHADYRNTNQGRAAELIDGTLLKPGETFSFNDTVGERTEAGGFTTGSVINGGQFRDELGGGVSQVVTTTYNAAFFAGLDDVEHHPHAFYIDRYPVGREATVYFGSLDLQFKNSTDHGVLIKASIDPSTPGSRGTMRVEMWSTKVWDIEAGASERRNARSPGLRYDESDACVPQSPIGGFDIDIYRTFKQNGQTVKSETVTANYQAADRVVCGPRPDEDDEDDDD